MTLPDMAKRLNRDYWSQRKQAKTLPAAFFITDHNAVPDPQSIIAALPDVCGVIFRDYDHQARAEHGKILSLACRMRGLLFLVARDTELALYLGADGIHLPEVMMDQTERIRTTQPNWIITTACHDRAAVRRAEKLSVDAGLIAPVFPTFSHPETTTGQAAALGLPALRKITAASTIPLYALGGVNGDTAGQLIGSGVAGIAAIRGFKKNGAV